MSGSRHLMARTDRTPHLSVGDLIAELEQLGVRLWEEGGQLRFRAPKGVLTDERRAALRAEKEAVLAYLRDSGPAALTPQPEAWHEPFPLTDVQAAYLVGQHDALAYGGVGCHGYGELAYPTLDPARLQAAVDALIQRHGMLRAVIDPAGSQRVLPQAPAYRVQVADLRGAEPDRAAAAVAATRAELDHRRYSPGTWPLFDIRVTLADGQALLHMSIDFLIADFVSIHVLLDELHRLYEDPDRSLPPLSITFRDYLFAERARRTGGRYERDRAYWWQRVDHLPATPELPVLEQPAAGGSPVRFRRWEATLAPQEWAALRGRAAQHSITPSVAVLAAYTEVIGRWSRVPRFTLDLTLLNRPPVHPEINQIVGDFTSISLLAADTGTGAGFAERARTLQAQLWQDLDHRLCSGLEVIREIARRRGGSAALFPVVFTSAIGLRETGTGEGGPGELAYGLSQTPQVWIDCQNIERGGWLATNWDVREGVFPDGLIDDMFAAYEALLRRLATGDEAWDVTSPVPLPPAQAERRRQVNDTRVSLPGGLLHAGVVAQARQTPGRVAVVSGGEPVTYGELLGRAAAVSGALHAAGCAPGDLVAILMDKGVEQVVAVLGALLSGAAYVPIDTSQPPARRAWMLADAGARYVLTQAWVPEAGWPEAATRLVVDGLGVAPLPAASPDGAVGPDGLAYVIYTSGSTGRPKGVMIRHGSARNTIEDINRRFGVTAADRILGLANLGFDLSVYDLFGPLAMGGCLVLPDPLRHGDPWHWADLVAEHGVTLWNSVPAQMQMLSDYLAVTHTVALPSLRLALLSGDWIPVGLPDRVRGQVPSLQVVSLGGATEASIWSIVHEIGEVPACWRSIPYGRPLANQTFHVLDALMRPCPDWVAGELYIGGAGLASGYLHDEVLTAERFIHHPQTGERLYHTGDIGRLLPSGDIEFLGREDLQVKIRGHRIELTEIETALQSHPAVAAAAVVVHGDRPLERRLAAFVQTARRVSAERQDADQAMRDRLLQAARDAGDEVRRGVDGGQIIAFARQLDETALHAMFHTLQEQGLFRTPAGTHSLEDIVRTARVAIKHHRLIRRWLRGLEYNGYVARDATGRYRRVRAIDATEVDHAWQRVDDLAAQVNYGVNYGAELLRYFRAAAGHLPELMRGDLDPLQLLFPEGRLEIHESAYNDNFLSRYLNRLVTTTISQIANQRTADEPLRLLEVGAGVGGTSIDLVPALAELDVDYLFTDVSQFFLNKAAERFRDYPRVGYSLFDLNEDYRTQGYEPNSFDVILCANVMHYARHAGHALARLRELLQPGGYLVFIETTRDNYQILTSMEFLFDATVTEFEDVRRGRDETFIGHHQWLDLLAEAGAETVFCLPEPSDVLAQIGMYAFVAQMKTDREPVRAAELTEYLTERLPTAMLPADIQVVDALPCTPNGKIDRATLRAWLPNAITGTPAAGGEPVDDLERRLARIWAEGLRLERVGRDQDFFALGGDSLLAAQLAGQVREQLPEAADLFFDDVLRALLEGATVASLAMQVRQNGGACSENWPARPRSPLVDLGGAGAGPACVLAHDATGMLSRYGTLTRALADQGRLVGLTLTDAQAYLARGPDVLSEWVAGEYARALIEAGHAHVSLVGCGLGGLLAAEVARQLTESGMAVEHLTVVGSCPPPASINDGVLVEYLFAYAVEADLAQLGFPSAAAVERAVAAVLARTGGLVPDGALAALAEPEHAPVSRAFQTWGARPFQDRLIAIGLAAPPADGGFDLPTQYEIFRHTLLAAAQHLAAPYTGNITLVRPLAGIPPWPQAAELAVGFWRDVCLGDLQVVDVPGAPDGCLWSAAAAAIAGRRRVKESSA